MNNPSQFTYMINPLRPFIILAVLFFCTSLKGNSLDIVFKPADAAANTPVSDIAHPLPFVELKVFPNPASDHIWVEFQLPDSSPTYLSCYNSMGQLVFRQSFGNQIAGDKHWKVDLSTMETGIYFLRIHWQSGQASTGILVQ